MHALLQMPGMPPKMPRRTGQFGKGCHTAQTHLVHHVVCHVGDALVGVVARGRLLSHPAAKVHVGLTTCPERRHAMCSCRRVWHSANSCLVSSATTLGSRLLVLPGGLCTSKQYEPQNTAAYLYMLPS